MNSKQSNVSEMLGRARGGSASGGPKLPSGLIGFGLLALIALWGVTSSYYTVQPEERAVVKRFGPAMLPIVEKRLATVALLLIGIIVLGLVMSHYLGHGTASAC